MSNILVRKTTTFSTPKLDSQGLLNEVKEKNQDLAKIKKQKAEKSGENQRMMMEYVSSVLLTSKKCIRITTRRNGR